MATSELDKSDFKINKSSIMLEKMIGQGGYAQIWSASLTTATGQVVRAAAKKVRSINVKEVQVMKEVQHRNVITFYGVLQDGVNTYIIMELAENDLRCYLDRCKEKKTHLPIDLVWKWAYEAACGICYLHENHHTHRDIKSLNYLIMNDLTLKLGDMGLAKVMDNTQQESGVRGTCRWMAPEVIKEQLRSVRSDVFSFGIVLWEVFTTEIPFADKHGDFQVMNAICSGQRPVIPDDCPQKLKQLIEMCWQDEYCMRPDMKTMRTMLEKCIQKEQSCEALSQWLQQAVIGAPSPSVQSGEEEMAMDTLSGSHAHQFAQVQGAQGDNLDTDNNKGHDDGLSQKMYLLSQGDVDMTSVSPHSTRQGVQSQPIDDYTSTDTVAMYKMCHVPRGICLIINNVDFTKARENNHRQLFDREGSDKDVKKLEEVFTKFKFTVVTKSNLTSKEFYDELDCNRRTDHETYDAFVCCILTHGKLGGLAGCDGQYLAIQEILNLYTAEKCPSLRGKPKMFFIQACQGVASQEKHSVQQDAPQQTGIGAALDKTIPNQADFLLGFATVSGHVSYRNTVLGSWYINVLVNKLYRLHEKEDLLSILTEVNRKLSKESAKTSDGGEYGQISAPVTTLRKKVYFTLWESNN